MLSASGFPQWTGGSYRWCVCGIGLLCESSFFTQEKRMKRVDWWFVRNFFFFFFAAIESCQQPMLFSLLYFSPLSLSLVYFSIHSIQVALHTDWYMYTRAYVLYRVSHRRRFFSIYNDQSSTQNGFSSILYNNNNKKWRSINFFIDPDGIRHSYQLYIFHPKTVGVFFFLSMVWLLSIAFKGFLVGKKRGLFSLYAYM